VQPHSRDQSPGRPSPGVRFPFRAELCLGCPRSGIVAPTYVGAASCRARESPLLGFLLPSSTSTPGAPCRTHRELAPAAGRVRVTRPSPVPSSGFLPLSTVLAALAARAVIPLTEHARRSPWCPDASRPCSMPLAPIGVALQSFPFPRSRTRSRGPLLPCGFAQTAQRRGSFRGFRGPFRRSRRPLAAAGPKARRTEEAGTTVPWSRSGAARITLPWSFATSRLGSAGLAGLGGRHAHFGALLSSRVRSRILTAALARVRSTGRCSPGPSSPLEPAPAARGFGVRASE